MWKWRRKRRWEGPQRQTDLHTIYWTCGLNFPGASSIVQVVPSNQSPYRSSKKKIWLAIERPIRTDQNNRKVDCLLNRPHRAENLGGAHLKPRVLLYEKSDKGPDRTRRKIGFCRLFKLAIEQSVQSTQVRTVKASPYRHFFLVSSWFSKSCLKSSQDSPTYCSAEGGLLEVKILTLLLCWIIHFFQFQTLKSVEMVIQQRLLLIGS